MTEQQGGPTGGDAPATPVSHEEWPAFCTSATERLRGHQLVLYYLDQALGEVRLAEGQPFVALEHDIVAELETLTIKYGEGVVPMRHVIVEPSEVLQYNDEAGQLQRVTILDGTGRKTFLDLP